MTSFETALSRRYCSNDGFSAGSAARQVRSAWHNKLAARRRHVLFMAVYSDDGGLWFIRRCDRSYRFPTPVAGTVNALRAGSAFHGSRMPKHCGPRANRDGACGIQHCGVGAVSGAVNRKQATRMAICAVTMRQSVYTVSASVSLWLTVSARLSPATVPALPLGP